MLELFAINSIQFSRGLNNCMTKVKSKLNGRQLLILQYMQGFAARYCDVALYCNMVSLYQNAHIGYDDNDDNSNNNTNDNDSGNILMMIMIMTDNYMIIMIIKQ